MKVSVCLYDVHDGKWKEDVHTLISYVFLHNGILLMRYGDVDCVYYPQIHWSQLKEVK